MSWGVATQNGVSVSLASIVSLSCGATEAFSPLSLFTSGVQGAWYDPSDVLLNWRYNLLTYTQQFDNAAWVASAATIDGTTGYPDPIGGNTADRITFSSVAGRVQRAVNAASQCLSIYVKPVVGTRFAINTDGVSGADATVFNLSGAGSVVSTGANNSNSVVTAVGSGWYRISTARGTTVGTNIYLGALNSGGGSTDSFDIWGAQLELGSVATTYQPITDGVQDYYTYDPQPVLFQDSAGTTPVTAVEQPVGLMLDKSQGLSGSGSQLVTNGDFSSPSTTGWQASGGGSFAVVSNRLQVTGAGATGTGAAYTLATVVGMTYSVSYDVVLGTAAVADSQMSLSVFAGASIGSSYQYSNVSSTLKYSFVATATTTYFQFHPRGVGNTAFIDNFSVVSLGMGNHASQATTASRPVLRARYNLLTYSEQFDNAVWTTTSATVSANTTATTDPLGGNTADSLVASAASSQHRIYQAVTSSDYTLSVYAKAGTASFISLSRSNTTAYATFNLSTGVVSVSAGGTATIQNAGNGWWRCAIASTVATSYLQIAIGNTAANAEPNVAWLGAGENVYVWGAQTITGSSAGTYQRIAAATDYATAGFLPYLALDGTDDGLATASIDFTATNKVSIFSGFTKLADSATGTLVELSSSYSANTGAFAVQIPQGASLPDMVFSSNGTTFRSVVSTIGAAPITRVTTNLADISAPSILSRVDGVAGTPVTSSQGTGNYGTYPLYLGRRAGTSLPFNGRIYQLIICGKTASASEIANTEAFVATKTGVTL